jgi:hypothetical protein
LQWAEKRISFSQRIRSDLEGRIRREMIDMKKSIVLVSMTALILTVAGCASYGALRLQSGPGETVTLQQLKEGWEKYNILATGVEPNVPSAIVFDRKEDGREIIGERWWPVKDYQSVSETVGWIEVQSLVGPYYPRLWKILGPDGHLYGYMFTAWDHAVMPIGDDKTMRVMDLPVPPYLAVSGPDVRDSAR